MAVAGPSEAEEKISRFGDFLDVMVSTSKMIFIIF